MGKTVNEKRMGMYPNAQVVAAATIHEIQDHKGRV